MEHTFNTILLNAREFIYFPITPILAFGLIDLILSIVTSSSPKPEAFLIKKPLFKKTFITICYVLTNLLLKYAKSFRSNQKFKRKEKRFYSISIEWMTLHARGNERRQQRSLLVEKIDNDFRKLLFASILAENELLGP